MATQTIPIIRFAPLVLIPFSDIWVGPGRVQFQNSWNQDI